MRYVSIVKDQIKEIVFKERSCETFDFANCVIFQKYNTPERENT